MIYILYYINKQKSGGEMEFDQILIQDTATIREAIERLEKVRCKIVYVVHNQKLKGSISDGDARRFLLYDGDISKSIKYIANFMPRFFYENQIEEATEFLKKNEFFSVPILNYNQEIVSVYFKNQLLVKGKQKLVLPVVIMAGGKGTRLYPYTKILPKALIPIGDIPITEHIINRFSEYGCRDFYMIVNHKKNMIKSYFDNIEKSYNLHYIDEEQPLGTGGGLSLLKGKIKTDFILSNCDVLIDAKYDKIYNYHQEGKNFITIIAANKCEKIPYGVLKIDKDGCYQGITEKPEYYYQINTGVSIVHSQVIEELEEEREITFPDIVDKYFKQGKKVGIYSIETKAYMDMGQFEKLENMKEQLKL